MTDAHLGKAAYRNPAILLAGTLAAGIWALAGCWARDNGTDGYLPKVALAQIAPDAMATGEAAAAVERLCRAGLLADQGDRWEIRQFGLLGKPRKRSALTPSELSAIRAEAGRRGAEALWAKRRAAVSSAGTPASVRPALAVATDGSPMANGAGLPSVPSAPRIKKEEEEVRATAPAERSETKPETEPEVAEPAPLTDEGASAHDRLAHEVRRIRRLRQSVRVEPQVRLWAELGAARGIDALPAVRAAVDAVAAKLEEHADAFPTELRMLRYLDRVVGSRVNAPPAPARREPSYGARPPASRPMSDARRGGAETMTADEAREDEARHMDKTLREWEERNRPGTAKVAPITQEEMHRKYGHLLQPSSRKHA